MAFDDVKLPDNIEQGAQGGPAWNTQLLTLGSGFEQRNQNWSRPRHSFNVSYGVSDLSDLVAVRTFFMGRRGRARGFRFKDWSDYTCVGSVLPPLSSSTWQLGKNYADAVTPYFRQVTRVVPGTLHVFDGATEVAFTESYGLITPATHVGAISASFEFDVPCRFDQDTFDITIETILSGQVPAMNIIEILEDTLLLNGIYS